MARLGEFRMLASLRTYSTTGGSVICIRDWGYSGSVQFTSLQPTMRAASSSFPARQIRADCSLPDMLTRRGIRRRANRIHAAIAPTTGPRCQASRSTLTPARGQKACSCTLLRAWPHSNSYGKSNLDQHAICSICRDKSARLRRRPLQSLATSGCRTPISAARSAIPILKSSTGNSFQGKEFLPCVLQCLVFLRC
jgi:hypothetical protein